MNEYGIREHAILAACLVKSACTHLSEEEGRRIMGRAIYAYGMGRGGRMAIAAESIGLPLDMTAYLLCGEWKGKEGESVSTRETDAAYTVSTVQKCKWFDTWCKEGLEAYGPLYCQFVDQGIADGFGGAVRLQIEASKANGDPACLFHWTPAVNEEKLKQLQGQYKDAFIRPFSFHCIDLISACARILQEEAPESSQTIMLDAKAEAERHLGIDLTEVFDENIFRK